MGRKFLIIFMMFSQLLAGCVTPRLWQKKTDLTEKRESLDSVEAFYSPSINKYCIVLPKDTSDSKGQKNRIIHIFGGSHAKSHGLLLALQKEHETAERYAEYLFYRKSPKAKQEPKPIDSSSFLESSNLNTNEQPRPSINQRDDWADDVLSFGIWVPLVSKSDELVPVDSEFVMKRFNRADTSYYMPSIDINYVLHSLSNTGDDLTVSQALLRFLFEKEGRDQDMKIENIQALKWLDSNGDPLVREKGVDAYSRADSLLVSVVTTSHGNRHMTHYRYRSQFYLLLERFGAFNSSFYEEQKPDVYLLRFDKKNNRALIGFQTNSKVELTAEGRRIGEAAKCSGDDWLQVADANGKPYVFTIIETHENESYRNSPVARALLTPFAVATDIVLSAALVLAFLLGILGPR